MGVSFQISVLQAGWRAVPLRPRPLRRALCAVSMAGEEGAFPEQPPSSILTRLCWKWEPTPIPEGEPGEGTGEELGEEWRFPVMRMPMSLSMSSGNGRSTNMSSRGKHGEVKK